VITGPCESCRIDDGFPLPTDCPQTCRLWERLKRGGRLSASAMRAAVMALAAAVNAGDVDLEAATVQPFCPPPPKRLRVRRAVNIGYANVPRNRHPSLRKKRRW
jgi:hypothetical protein